MPVDETVALPSRRDPASLRSAGLLPPPVSLEPVVDGHGLDWFGADLRTV